MIVEWAEECDLQDLIAQAIVNYNDPSHYLPDEAMDRRLQEPATIHSEMGFLRRIVQNYLRHSCTDYDAQLAALEPSHPDWCHCQECSENPDSMVDGECQCTACSGGTCDYECTDPDEVEQVREMIQLDIDCQWDSSEIDEAIQTLRRQSPVYVDSRVPGL
jgi:hypothetical protein